MSADNGIYILETKGPEFRLAAAFAIDNAQNKDGSPNLPWIRQRFGKSRVFGSKEDATKAADALSSTMWTEYGVNRIKFDFTF